MLGTELFGRCAAFWAGMGSLHPCCPLEWPGPFQVALRQSGRMKFYLSGRNDGERRGRQLTVRP